MYTLTRKILNRLDNHRVSIGWFTCLVNKDKQINECFIYKNRKLQLPNKYTTYSL